MRFLLVAGLSAALLLAAGCGRESSAAAENEPLLRVRFAGTRAALTTLQPGPLREVWTHDETRRLGGLLAVRLAELAAPVLGVPAKDLEPLALELLERGGLVQWEEEAGRPRLSVVSVGDSALAARWQSVVGGGSRVTATNGNVFLAPVAAVPRGLAAAWDQPLPEGVILTLEARGRAVAERLGLADAFPFGAWPGHVTLRVTPRPRNLAMAAELRLERPLAAPAGAWTLPVELLRDPIQSFSAARGAGAWVRRWLEGYGLPLPAAPEQVFTWSHPGLPWLSYAAGALPDPAAALAAAGPDRLPKFLERVPLRQVAGGLTLTNTGQAVELRGLPWIAPLLAARTLKGGSFLVAGLLPLPPAAGEPPAELLAQVQGRTNLLWYAWETTGTRVVLPPEQPGGQPVTNLISRLDHLRQLRQLLTLLDRDPRTVTLAPQFGVRLPGDAWMAAVTPSLGDTVTELVQVAPDRLEFRRVAVTGFTSLEMMHLLNWLDPLPPAPVPAAGAPPPMPVPPAP